MSQRLLQILVSNLSTWGLLLGQYQSVEELDAIARLEPASYKQAPESDIFSMDSLFTLMVGMVWKNSKLSKKEIDSQ